MNLPKEIITRNKIRDAKICLLYARDFLTMDEIGQRVGLTGSRVQQIIYKNRSLLVVDKEYEKLKRLAVLKRVERNAGEKLSSRRDVLDVLEQQRLELEGNKVEHSGEIKTGKDRVIIIREMNGNQSEAGRLSGSLLTIPE